MRTNVTSAGVVGKTPARAQVALVEGFDAVLAAQTAECLHGNPEGVARVLVTPVRAGHALDLVERCLSHRDLISSNL